MLPKEPEYRQIILPIKWEYKRIDGYSEKNFKEVQEAGLEGWQLIKVTEEGWYIMERKIIETESYKSPEIITLKKE